MRRTYATLALVAIAVVAVAGGGPTPSALPPVHVWDTRGDPVLAAQEAFRDRAVDHFLAVQAGEDARVAAQSAQTALHAWTAAAAARAPAPKSVPVPAPTPLPTPTPTPRPAMTPPTSPLPTVADFAWTPIPAPSAGTRTIYVSPSGNDGNDGLSEQTPVRSPYRAAEKVRSGFPDRILFQRGGVFRTNAGPLQMPGWTLPAGRATWIPSRSGRSAAEPMVYATYGAGPRPVLLDGRFQVVGGNNQNLFVTGLEFRADALRESTGAGVFGLDGGSDILLEDLLVAGYVNNVTLQGQNAPFDRLRVRGCVIVDAHRAQGGGHSQGLHVTNAHDLLIEGCVFDRNGWSPAVPGAVATVFNHNVYVQYTCSGVVYRNNVSARASSHGLQLRPGGTCEENLFLANPIGALFGADGGRPDTGGTFAGNVILDGGDIDPTNRRGWGADFIGLTVPTDAHHNVVAHNTAGTGGARAFCIGNGQAGSGPTMLTLRDNVAFRFGRGFMVATNGVAPVSITRNRFEAAMGPVFTSNPPYDPAQYTLAGNLWWSGAPQEAWFVIAGVSRDPETWFASAGETGSSVAQAKYPDPSRTIATYAASLGLEPTLDAFLAEARQLSRAGPARPQLMANRVNAYIRAGFGVGGD